MMASSKVEYGVEWEDGRK